MRRCLYLVVAAVLLAACSTPATAPAPEEDAATPAQDGEQAGGLGADGLQAVYDELEGLEDEQRRTRLLELVEAEGDQGGFAHYTSMNLDNSGPIADAFEEAYGIEQELYRATGTTIVQRVTQEAEAGFAGSDVVSLNGTEISQIDGAGLLLPLETPATEDVVEVRDTWASNYLNVFITAWNSDIVEQPPTTWTEALTAYPGQLSIELGDFDWFATLVQGHLMEQEGLTEEEAVELVRGAASEAYVVDGHTVQNELLASGEFGVAPSVYLHNTLQQIEAGAPLAWDQPAPVQPLIVRSNGIGINADTDRPATALLFVEYVLTEAQEQIASFGRTPGNSTAPGGIPEEYETLVVDLEALLADEDKWRTLYEEVTRDAQIQG